MLRSRVKELEKQVDFLKKEMSWYRIDCLNLQRDLYALANFLKLEFGTLAATTPKRIVFRIIKKRKQKYSRAKELMTKIHSKGFVCSYPNKCNCTRCR